MTDSSQQKLARSRRSFFKAISLTAGAVAATAVTAKQASAAGALNPPAGQCFARGTRIKTADGYRLVETLAAGDGRASASPAVPATPTPTAAAPSPKKATATSPVLRCFAEIAAPTADGMPPPTRPLVPNRMHLDPGKIGTHVPAAKA